jgi:hypothetical protein
MTSPLRYLGQAVWYAAIALVLGAFAMGPAYRPFAEDRAMVKLSFAHGASRQAECRRRTAEELAKLPHKERALYACERRRVSLHVELEIDGALRFAKIIAPGGLGKDGPARVYERFVVAPGRHVVVARLRDSGRKEGFDYERRAEVEIKPRQNLVIDFHADQGGFIIR